MKSTDTCGAGWINTRDRYDGMRNRWLIRALANWAKVLENKKEMALHG